MPNRIRASLMSSFTADKIVMRTRSSTKSSRPKATSRVRVGNRMLLADKAESTTAPNRMHARSGQCADHQCRHCRRNRIRRRDRGRPGFHQRFPLRGFRHAHTRQGTARSPGTATNLDQPCAGRFNSQRARSGDLHHLRDLQRPKGNGADLDAAAPAARCRTRTRR